MATSMVTCWVCLVVSVVIHKLCHSHSYNCGVCMTVSMVTNVVCMAVSMVTCGVYMAVSMVTGWFIFMYL